MTGWTVRSPITGTFRHVRQMPGLGDVIDSRGHTFRTIFRNAKLLAPDRLANINQLVVEEEQVLVGCEPGAPLEARCDSVVVETERHFLTDISLMRDEVTSLATIAAGACRALGVAGWRQGWHLLKKVLRNARVFFENESLLGQNVLAIGLPEESLHLLGSCR